MNQGDQLSENVHANLSKVSPAKKKNLVHFYWLVGAFSFILLAFFMSSHATEVKDPDNSVYIGSDYTASLTANLAHLKELKDKPTIIDNTINEMPSQFVSDQPSNEYLARQNAPTSMYTGPINETVITERRNKILEATFAGQGPNENFANAQTSTTAVEAKTIPHPGFTIASGEFLHAVLETAVNSDLPGMVRAVVSAPGYSYTGQRTIIPAGSRLIGQYSSALLQGQNRVIVVWNRVVLPSGIVVQLNSPGSDSLGRAGQGADSVNTHFMARFAESALLSVIGATVANSGVNGQDQYNSASQYRMSIAESFQQSANKSLEDNLPIKPTINIYQGAKINVFVAHDLSFYKVLKNNTGLTNPIPSFVR